MDIASLWSGLLRVKKSSLFTVVILLGFLVQANQGFSQATPYPSTDATNYPRHETLEQRIIEVRFTGTLSGTTDITQWTVNVGATATLLSGTDFYGKANGLSNSATGPFSSSISPTGSSIFIKFSAENVAGHVNTSPYIFPTETNSLTFSFVNTGSTLKTLAGGASIAAFGPIQSKNKYVPTCLVDVKFSSSGLAPFASLDQCSPVNTNFWRWTYEYSLAYRNSSGWVTSNNLLSTRWQDPALTVTFLPGYLTDGAGTPSPNTFNINSLGVGIPSVFLSFRAGFNPTTLVVDPASNPFSYPDNSGLCNFVADVNPFTPGFFNCGGVAPLRKLTPFDSYDYDDQNTGSLSLTPTTPPTTPTSDLVCLGTNVGVQFTDASVFNCIGNGTVLPTPGQGAQATPVNNAQRWVRFIYGGFPSPTPQGNIRDIHVNGTQVTDPVTGALSAGLSPNPKLFPYPFSDFAPNATPMKNGYVVPGVGGLGVEDANGVIQLNVGATATTSGLISKLITTLSTTNHVVGQRFYVTLQYWGVCNPYPASAPVEISVDYVEIVTKPSTPVNVDKNLCSGTSANPPSVACGSITVANQALSFEVSAASVAGSTGINWYFGDPTLGGVLLTSTYGANCRFFRPGDLSVAGAQGVMRSALIAGTVGSYSLWATQLNTGTNTCESLPVEVKIIVNPLPSVNNQTPVAVCSDSAVGVNFGLSTNGTAAATYNVTALNLNGMTVSAGGAAVANGLAVSALADDAFTNTSNIQKNVVYTVTPVSALGCLGSSFTVTVPVNPEPAVSNQTPTVCSDIAVGISFGASSGVAASTYNVTALNLNGLTVSAGGAAVVNGLAAAALADDAFTNTTAANVNVVYTVVPVAATGCLGNPFTVTVTVRPEPVVANQAPAAICSDAVVGVNFNASTSVAASTYNVTALNLNGLTVSGGGAAVASGLANTALANDSFTNTTNAQVNVIYTVVPVSAAGCLGNPFTVTVPVNPEPVVGNQTPASVCSTVPVGVSFAASSNGLAAATYNVTALNLNGLTIAAGGPAVANGLLATALADDAFNNTTSGTVNVIYTVTPVSALGCPGNSFTVTVPVNPQPVVANQTPSACSQAAVGVNFNSSTSIAATSYNVTALNLNGLTVFAGGPAVANGLAPTALADDAFTNSTGSPVNVIYTVVPVSASNCLGNSFTVTLTVNPRPVGSNAAAAPICSGSSVGYNLQTQNININNSVPSNFSWLALVDNINVSGESLSANTSSTLNDVLVNTSGSDQTVTYTVTPTSAVGCLGASFTVSVIVRGPTVSIGGAATQAICSGNTLALTTTETYTSGSFTSRAWTGSFDENFGAAPAIIASLSNAQMDAILGNRTLQNPTFNSDGLGVGKVGAYVLTYTATDNNGCTASAVVTINVSQVGAQIRFGPTAVTATNTSLNATVCSGVNLFLDGTPSGGTGTYATHTWSVVSPPATPIGTVLTAGSTTATPTFNFSNLTAASAVFVLRYSVTDNQGCNFTTSAPTDITITVNPQPVVAVQTPAVVCSRTAVGVNFNSSTSVAAATYNVTALNLNGLTVSGGGAAVANGLLATALADDAFLNTTNAQVNVIYTVVPVSAAGCTGASFTVTVPVNPQPVVAVQTPAAVCSGTVVGVNFNASTSVAAATYNVTALNLNGLTVSGGGAAVANGLAATALADDAFLNTTNAQVSVIYTVVPVSAAGCLGSSFTVTVPVNPQPVVAVQTPAAVCSRSVVGVNFNASTSVAAATYNVTALNLNGLTVSGGGAAVANGLPATALADDAFLNTTNAQVSVIYTVVPVSAAGCLGASFTVTVPVNPQPVVAAQTPAAVCSRSVVGVNFNASTSVAAATYNVTALNLNGLTVSAGGAAVANGLAATALADDAFLNTTNAQVSVIYTVVPVSAAGCQGASFTVTVPVDPQPVVAVQTPAAVCSSTAVGVNFNASTSVAAATYNVTALNLNGLSVSAGGAAVANGLLVTDLADDAFLNTTNVQVNVIYTVVPVSAAGCQGASFTVTVPVNPRPIIPDQVSTICSGATFTVTPVNGGATVVPAGTKYTWPAPTVAPTPGSLTGAVAQGVGVASISQALTNTTNVVQTATYVVTPISGAGCTGATFQVTVTVNPKPVIFNRVATICSGDTFTVSPVDGNPLATTIVPAGTTYAWGAPVVTAGITGGSAQTGQASISQTLTTTSSAPGTATYTVTPTSGAAGTCGGASFQVVVTVNPIPKLSSTLTPGAICSGLFTYTPTSATAGATFSWTRANVAGINEVASSGTGPVSETLTNPTTLPVVVTYVYITSANGCNNSPGENVQVTVNPTPLPNPIIGPANACVSSNTFFYQVTQVPGSTYSWDIPAEFTVQAAGGGAMSGGGPGPYSSDYFILLKFGTATTKTITVFEKSADGCIGLANSLSIAVSNGPTVVPIVSSTGATTFCKNETGVVFLVPQNASSNFIWSIDSGGSIVGPSAGTNLYQIVVNFNNSPTANINVTEINIAGCPATYPTFVASMLDAPVMTPASGTICSGGQPSDVITLSTTPAVASTFSWVVKSIDPNVTGAFQNDTGTGPLTHAVPLKNISGSDGTIVYTVKPTATAAPFCIGLSQDYTVTVKPEPVVSVIADQSVCPLAFVNGAVLFPFSSNVGGAIFNWTSSNPAIGLAAPSGTGAISFTAADNLTGLDIVSTITVTATANGCTSAGANAKTFTITVKPRPVVGVVADISVCPGDAISVPAFTANTSGGETYAWTNDNALIGLPLSGNGNISAYFAPANNTGSDLVGNISVIATTNGCPGPALTFKITVKPQPVVAAIADKTFCAGDAISIPLSSNVGTATINWSNSNTGIGLAASGTGNIVGVAPVNNSGADIVGTIIVTASDNGCTSSGSNSKTFTITIKPTPIVDPLPNVVVCSGGAISTIAFGSNVSAGAVTFNWTNDNPAINLAASGTGNIPAFTAATNISGVPMIANISVTGTKNGCAGPAVLFTITVNPEPVVSAIANQLFCPTDVVNIPLSSNVGAATISWTNSNTAIGLLSSGSGNISFTAAANNTGANITATISVTATAAGCTSAGANAKSFTITIKPTPIVTAIPDVTVCSGAAIPAIVFSANTGGGEVFNWTNDNIAIGLPASSSGNISSYLAPVNISGVPMVANFTVSATKNGCTGPAQTFKITVNPEPVVAAVANQSFCAGEAISIPLTSNVAGAVLSWSNTNTSIGLAASGSGNISYIAPVNNSGVDIVGSITVIATANGCVSAGANTKTFSITIKPTPIVTAIPNVTVCSGGAVVGIVFSSNVVAGGVTFDWTNDNTAINLVASGTGNIAGFTAPVNTTSSPMVATISVTGTKNTCVGPAKTFTITVLPQPVGTPTLKTICSDEAVAVNLSTLITGGAAASTYDITITPNGLTASAGSPVSGTGKSATEIQDDKWTNITGSAVNVIYTIRPNSIGSPSCAGDPFDLTVTVNPEPVVAVIANQIFCPSEVVSIPLTSNVAGATISWTNTNPAIGLAFSGTGNINYTTAVNNTGANITATISVIASNNGCTSTGANAKSFTITIKPSPIVTPVTDATACSGAMIPPITFSANTGGSEVFNWTNDNALIGLPASGSGNISSYAAPVNVSGVPMVANFTVSATKNGCTGPNQTFKITVNPEPVITAVANQSFCTGEAISIPLTSNVASAVISWTNTNSSIGLAAAGSGNISYIAPANNTGADIVGTITVIGTANGCVSAGANAKSFTITIKPTPIVNAITNIVVCSGQPVAAIAFSSNVGAGVTYDWSNDNTAINLGASGSGPIPSFTAATNTTSSPLVATISVTGTKNGCLGPVRTFTITVNPQPVGIPTSATICSDLPVGINLASLLSGSAASYSLSINSNGLVASAGAPADGSGFSATEIQDDRWTNISGAPVNVVYRITPLGAGSPACAGAPFDLTVTINPEPVVTAIANKIYCPASVETIALLSNVPGASITWTNTNPLIGLGFSGSGDINFTTPANNTGANITGTITVTASKDGCTSSGTNIKTFDITIKPTPIVAAVGDITVCSGALVPGITFTANTGGSETFNWTNDNALIGVAGSGIGNIAGYTAPVNISGVPMVANFSVTATKNGCVGPAVTFKITVNPEPVVTAITDKSFCAGDAINIPFTSNVAGASISWTNSNAAIGIGTSGAGDMIYTAPSNNTGADIVGTIVVTASKNGCVSVGANSKTFTVTIKPTPIVNAMADIVVCSGQPINVPSFGSNVVAGGVTFNWTNDNPAINLAASGTGDITAFTAATNISGLPITANISVTGTKNLCGGPAKTFTITINPEPVVTAVTNKDYCPGDLVNIPLTSNVSGAVISWTNSNTLIGTTATGSGDIVFTAPANNTGVDFVGTLVVSASKNGCTSIGVNTKSFTITIKATPVVAAITSIVVCSGDPIPAIPFTSNADPGVTFDWTNDNTGINLAASGTGNIAGFASAVNLSSVPLIANISVRGTKNGCQGAARTFTITINPEPVVLVPAPTPICSGSITNITLSTNGTSAFAASYRLTLLEYSSNGGPFSTTPPTDFTFPGANKTVGSSGLADHIKSDLFTNKSPFSVVVRYTIVPVSAATVATPLGCDGDPVPISITVNPEPALDPSVASICSGDKIDPLGTAFELKSKAGSVAAANFIIRSISFPGMTAGGTNAPVNVQIAKDALDNDTFINVTNIPLTATYTIAPISALIDGGCVGTDEVVVITVNPAPALASGLDKIVCSGAITGIVLNDNSPTSIAATQYEIMSVTLNGLTPDAGNALTGTTTDIYRIKNDKFINTTTDRVNVIYRIRPISGAGCVGPAVDVTVTVEPLIVTASINHAPDICSGTPVNIEFSSPTYANGAGTNPVVTFSYKLLTPIPAGITGYTTGNSLPEGDAIGDVLINSTNAPITVHYQITARAATAANGVGCPSTPEVIDVIVQPRPKITSITNKTICEGDAVNLSLASPSLPGTGVIKFLVTAVPENASVTGFTTGTYLSNSTILADVLSNSDVEPRYVDYTFEPQNVVAATNAIICANGTPITVRVTVNPRPVVTATPQTPLTICSGESIEVSLLTDTDPSSSIVKWTALASSLDVVGESNGAGETLFQTLLNKGNAVQTVDYTITPSFNTCAGAPIHVLVTVNPFPIVTLPTKVTVCAGTPFALNLLPLVNTSAALTTFKWEVTDVNGIGTPGQFDGTGTAINQSFTNNSDASATMLYQITPIGPGGCEGTPKIVNVTVAPTITAAFVSANEGVCEGTPVFLTFELHGQPPFDFTYNEIKPSGTILHSVSKSGNIKVEKVTPLVTTTYEIVSVKDALNCNIALSPKPKVTITVFKAVTAQWTANIPPFIGGNSKVTFTNTSTVLDASLFRYEWSFGTDAAPNPLTSTSIGPTIDVNYNRPGDHYVTLRVVNIAAEAAGQSCESTYSAKISIPVLPLVADFKFTPAAACFPQNIKVTENTATGNTMDWKVYDSNGKVTATSAAALPEFLISTPGVYTIVLKTSDSFTGQTAFSPTKEFTVFANPVASFQARPTTIFVPDTELITANFSTGATDYEWQFGDGGTADERTPTHFYKIEGIYEIMMIAKNDHGGGVVCKDTIVQKVTAKQGGVTKVPNAFTPNGNGPSGGHVNNGGNGSGDMNNDVFLPFVKGVEEFNMEIFDRWGNMIFESNDANTGWDGYDKNGKLMQSGVYVYKLTLRLSDGQRTTQLGDITLIR